MFCNIVMDIDVPPAFAAFGYTCYCVLPLFCFLVKRFQASDVADWKWMLAQGMLIASSDL